MKEVKDEIIVNSWNLNESRLQGKRDLAPGGVAPRQRALIFAYNIDVVAVSIAVLATNRITMTNADSMIRIAPKGNEKTRAPGATGDRLEK